MGEKVEDVKNITVSAKVIANIIGVGERRVRQLADEGILIRSSQGRYLLNDSLHSYILMLKVENDGKTEYADDGDEVSFDKEKAYHERASRHMAELKLAKMKGEVHESKNVQSVMTDMLMNFKTKCLGIPSKIAPILESKSKTYILDYMRNEMNQLLEELTDYSPKDFYGDDYMEYETEEEDDNEQQKE